MDFESAFGVVSSSCFRKVGILSSMGVRAEGVEGAEGAVGAVGVVRGGVSTFLGCSFLLRRNSKFLGLLVSAVVFVL